LLKVLNPLVLTAQSLNVITFAYGISMVWDRSFSNL